MIPDRNVSFFLKTNKQTKEINKRANNNIRLELGKSMLVYRESVAISLRNYIQSATLLSYFCVLISSPVLFAIFFQYTFSYSFILIFLPRFNSYLLLIRSSLIQGFKFNL